MYRPEFSLTEQSACRAGERVVRHADCGPLPAGPSWRQDRFSTALPQHRDFLPVVLSFGRSCVILDDIFYYAGGMINWLRVP